MTTSRPTSPQQGPSSAHGSTIDLDFEGDATAFESQVSNMADRVVELGRRVVAALTCSDALGLEEIRQTDMVIDHVGRQIAERGIEIIAGRPLDIDALRQILVVGRSARHLERVADCLVEAATMAQSQVLGAGVDDVPPQLAEMGELVTLMTARAIDALVNRDAGGAEALALTDGQLEDLEESVFGLLVDGESVIGDRRRLLAVDRVARQLERAGDHAVTIAEETLFLVTGEHRDLGRRNPSAAS